jgi:hypothetical protein
VPYTHELAGFIFAVKQGAVLESTIPRTYTPDFRFT